MKINNFLILAFCILGFISCEPQIYLPDSNADRDTDLFGTWRLLSNSIEDSSLYIFTNDGYVGSTSYVNNDQMNGFTNLHEIWENLEYIASDGWGKIYIADASSFWTKRRSENEKYYKFSDSKDTLYLAYINLRTKEADKENPSTFIKSEIQLIYEGAKYLGIDTTINNNQVYD